MRFIDLPLHTGHAPPWLFKRMVKLAECIVGIVIEEFGESELLNRLSDPIFFQAFSNVLGFDWNSSGSTTVLTAVLKEVLNSKDYGVKVAGGKGSNALKTPEEIRNLAEKVDADAEELVRISRLAAKLDNVALQDGYDLYHHAIFFTKKRWCVVQQGMNTQLKLARRYHLNSLEDQNIISQRIENEVLNLVSDKSEGCRKVILDVVRDGDFKRFRAFLPKRVDWKALEVAYNLQPENFEELLLVRGIGKRTVRALALISELIYNTPYDKTDPAKFCFALGGKDGVPYPVDVKTYDEVIEFLKSVLSQRRLDEFRTIYKRLAQVQASLRSGSPL
ncbi:DUF763 domain-containing protein [Archaeoglobus profundus]|uniref:DUF763 domain-containing protein n=1 Tax=Archaeoglobus profundus (strain DSM 5631 / JCM 9629 / NBRC 100127 / Av18) TaxID=572546 RepID=D2RF62_ARCPA|nr:DUF763 domain-containing protein [Archaeoglobus profundus]ADB58756.1 protein of unknown function DUF763 [Archaeoglobus profundus DSM 5631]